jgi:HSP20 family protein
MTLPVPRSGNQVARWDPWREFTDLQDRMGQLMQSVFGPLDELARAWSPLADLSETDDHFRVEVDLPGVQRDDISIEVAGNELSISGEIKEKERTGWLRHRTRRVGRFEHRTVLPREVDADGITAELSDGVLTVRVPKAASAKPRRIAITAK